MVGVIRSKHRQRKPDEKTVKAGKIIKVNKRGIEDFNDYFTKSYIDPDEMSNVSNNHKNDKSNDIKKSQSNIAALGKRSLEDVKNSNMKQLPNNKKSTVKISKPNCPRHRRKPNDEEVKKGKNIRVDKLGREIFADYFSNSQIEVDNTKSESGLNLNSEIAQEELDDNVNSELHTSNSKCSTEISLKSKKASPAKSDKMTQGVFDSNSTTMSLILSVNESNNRSSNRKSKTDNDQSLKIPISKFKKKPIKSPQNDLAFSKSLNVPSKSGCSSNLEKDLALRRHNNNQEVMLSESTKVPSGVTTQNKVALMKNSRIKKKKLSYTSNGSIKKLLTKSQDEKSSKNKKRRVLKRQLAQTESDTQNEMSSLEFSKNLSQETGPSLSKTSFKPSSTNQTETSSDKVDEVFDQVVDEEIMPEYEPLILSKIVEKRLINSPRNTWVKKRLTVDLSNDINLAACVNGTFKSPYEKLPFESEKCKSPKTKSYLVETSIPFTSPCRVAIRDLCNDEIFVEVVKNCSVSILGNEITDVGESTKTETTVSKPYHEETTGFNGKDLSRSKELKKIVSDKVKTNNTRKGAQNDTAMETLKESRPRKGSSIVKNGGKHFLQKTNISKRSRRFRNRDYMHYTIDTDTESDASESDGHIYITKSERPNEKTFDLPSTSGWKPPKGKKIEPKTKKPRPETASKISPENEKPRESPKPKKKLSTIVETDEVTTKSINVKLTPVVQDFTSPIWQPRVSLLQLNFPESKKNQKKLKSSLKGSHKKKSRLSVSFKDPEKDDDEMEISSCNMVENSRFIPLHTPVIKTPNCRRSMRKKVPRLDAGLNQRIVYKRRPSGGLVAVGIDLGCTNEVKPPRRFLQPRIVPQRDIDKSLSTHHPSVIHDDYPNSNQLMMFCPIDQTEILYNLFTKKESLVWYGPENDETEVFKENVLAKEADPFVFAKMFETKTFSMGLLKIRGSSEKPPSQLQDERSLMFYVNYGKLLIEIHNSKLVMETGDSFIIPEGNSYKVTNLRRDEASLVFYAT